MSTSIPTQLLADIRTKTKLSEVEMADRLGISQATVNRILNGKSECKAGTLVAIQQWHAQLGMRPPAEIAVQKVENIKIATA